MFRKLARQLSSRSLVKNTNEGGVISLVGEEHQRGRGEFRSPAGRGFFVDPGLRDRFAVKIDLSFVLEKSLMLNPG